LHYYFILSFGIRVHFQGQKLTFWQKKIRPKNRRPPWIIFSVKNCQIIIFHYREKYFFSILTNFFFILIKVAHCCEGSPKTIRTRSLIRNMVFGGFPKKNRNKTFYFHNKKKYGLYFFLLSFGPRVHFQGKKLNFRQNKSPPKNRRPPSSLKFKKFNHPFY
jgi:hypothetical protein